MTLEAGQDADVAVSRASYPEHGPMHGPGAFPFVKLPYELQRHIIECALEPGSHVSVLALLASCRSIRDTAWPILYEHLDFTSIAQLTRFIDRRQKQRKRIYIANADDASSITSAIAKLGLTSAKDNDADLLFCTRSFSFTLPGVPGGSTRGGRASALSSPERREQERRADSESLMEPSLSNRRLLLASRALLMCPNVEHCAISMFGVRHSSMLTSEDYLAEEASTFREALSQLRSLQTFAWITPRENDRFVGFSVACVDLVFGPLIEGLQHAAQDVLDDGRRRTWIVGSLQRYAHPLKSISLHHCILPMSSDPRKSIFYLFAQVHPDDEDWALFPHMRRVHIRTAIDVSPSDVAYLALFWQLRRDIAVQDDLSAVERYQVALYEGDHSPIVELSDVFVHSIWGPRVTLETVREEMEAFVCSSGPAKDEVQNGFGSITAESTMRGNTATNPFIKVLNESTDTQLRLSEKARARLRKLTRIQQRALVDAAISRVRITAVEGAIAGV